jgi:hypothetical protein
MQKTIQTSQATKQQTTDQKMTAANRFYKHLFNPDRNFGPVLKITKKMTDDWAIRMVNRPVHFHALLTYKEKVLTLTIPETSVGSFKSALICIANENAMLDVIAHKREKPGFFARIGLWMDIRRIESAIETALSDSRKK